MAFRGQTDKLSAMTDMNTIDLVDPELRPFLQLWPELVLTTESLADIRSYRAPLPEIDTSGVALRALAIPNSSGAPDIPLLVYTPESAAPRPAIFHMHGGGFVLGAAQDLSPIHYALARDLGCAIVSVDYRLAPETSFPGNIEDCYQALAWTFANASAEGIDATRIGVMGESAGGGLAAALALLARDRSDYRLAFQSLIYPMLDDRTGTVGDPHPTAGEFIWSAAHNRFGWAALLGQAAGTDGVSSYAAAARAEQLAGLPPTFIGTGSLDLFVEEDMDYARRLMRAGVAVELHVYPGAYHAFDIATDAGIAVKARRDCVEALRRFMQKPA